jgi:hypothetical protein
MQPIQPNPRRKATPLWKQDLVTSSMNKVMCECGAFYVPVKAKNQPGRTIPFKCILCNRELPQTAGSHIPNYRLIWRPDDDKE